MTNSNTQNIRGILIDPFTHTVTEVFVDGSDTLKAMRKQIQCDYVCRVALGSIRGIEQDLWIDDEGILCDWDTQAFFKLRGMPDPLAGRGIIFAGTEDGDTVGTTLEVERVTELMQWITPQQVIVPAPRMIGINEDGTESVTLLAGTESWSYTNQP
jgi:hypothetical protein